MRLFGKLDGGLNSNDKPFFYIVPFTFAGWIAEPLIDERWNVESENIVSYAPVADISSSWNNDYARVFGVTTDIHFKSPAEQAIEPSRHFDIAQQNEYRIFYNVEERFLSALKKFHSVSVNFGIQLGDYINFLPASNGVERLQYAESIRATGNYTGPFYHVLGNHESRFAGKWSNYADNITNSATIQSYIENDIAKAYCFENNGIRYIVLYGILVENMSSAQLLWLENITLSSSLPKVIFIHSHIAGYDYGLASGYVGLKNRAIIRGLLEADGNVQAVFSGHWHNDNVYELRNGIHYFGLRGSALGTSLDDGDCNAYYIVSLIPNASWNGTRYIANIKLDGFVDAINGTWTSETENAAEWSPENPNTASWSPETENSMAYSLVGKPDTDWSPESEDSVTWTPKTETITEWS